MVCTASDLQGWKDFPRGLKILLLDRDPTSSAQLKAKLEALDYIVYLFSDEDEALSVIASKCETFHVAIVEVTTENDDGCFKFLETARDLPTISIFEFLLIGTKYLCSLNCLTLITSKFFIAVVSDIHCLNTMMRCIALGAVEFLHKPLNEDKLKNIWQHVVHKAFNAGAGIVSGSLKPVKESLVSILQLKLENGEVNEASSAETENVSAVHQPSTPQLTQGAHFRDDGDCFQEQTNRSTEKDNCEQDGESKSVETTCNNSTAVIHHEDRTGILSVKDEGDSGDNNSKSEGSISPLSRAKDDCHGIQDCANNTIKSSGLQNSNAKANRKKMKVDWTPELHKKFVHAVEQLGVDQAIPSRILEHMKVEGLTRHNVASHLQKYRMNRRHILPKEGDGKWPQQREMAARSYHPNRPIVAFPSYHSNQIAYPPMWGLQGNHQPGMQFWSPPSYPLWQPAENWQWKPYPGLHAEAWGCPVMPHTQVPMFPYPQDGLGYQCAGSAGNISPQSSLDLHLAEEVVDKVVKEAMTKPWLPLPLGLKPPSTEGVLAELSRQGIPCIPPNITSPDRH
ncbi:hypothetical protein SAY86_020581 [Trapa natans]|uniref:Two-component response regulator-like APRR2 n=1 Tax=Trapa natans TaxID=22666 RepID=A0AAN7LZN5_TRANT|nr:hypothetical protein SAY86_020581 [Trapa natans]